MGWFYVNFDPSDIIAEKGVNRLCLLYFKPQRMPASREPANCLRLYNMSCPHTEVVIVLEFGSLIPRCSPSL